MDADYNPDFLRHIYPRIDWPTLRTAAQTLGAQEFCFHRLWWYAAQVRGL